MFDRYDEMLRIAREFERIRNNPAYQAAMEHQKRMANDPAYRAKMEHINRLQNDSAHQALLRFTENRHLYRQIDDLQSFKPIDDRALEDLRALRDNLAHTNAELWLKSDLLASDFDRRQFDALFNRPFNLIPIFPAADEFEDEEIELSEQPRIAARIVEDFYEDRLTAEQELEDDERLVAFVKLGKKEYRITNLAVEEKTNKIAAFLDDDEDAAFIYCSPFRVNYRFYKEKVQT